MHGRDPGRSARRSRDPSLPPARSRPVPRAPRRSRAGEIWAWSFLSSTPFSFGTPAEASRFPRGLDREDDLAELLARLEPLVRGADLFERQHRVDDRQRAAARDELVRAREVLAGSHRGAEDRELLPPDPVQRRRRGPPRRGAPDGGPAPPRPRPGRPPPPPPP